MNLSITRGGSRSLLFLLACLASAWALAVALTGGFAFTVGPLWLSSRDSTRPLIAGRGLGLSSLSSAGAANRRCGGGSRHRPDLSQPSGAESCRGRRHPLSPVHCEWPEILTRPGSIRSEGVRRGLRRSGAQGEALTPPNAIVLAQMHSGSVRYYAHRITLRYDVLKPEWLDKAVRALAEQGYSPYILLDDLEESDFRTRFENTSAGKLDWAPLADIPGPIHVRLYSGGPPR